MKKKLWRLNITCLSLDMGIPPRTDAYDGELRYEYDTDKLFMYANSHWTELIERPSEIKKKYPTICPNCGAPHNPNTDYCKYCGTFFE